MYELIRFGSLIFICVDLFYAIITKKDLNKVLFLLSSFGAVIVLNFDNNENNKVLATIYVFYLITYIAERIKKHINS